MYLTVSGFVIVVVSVWDAVICDVISLKCFSFWGWEMGVLCSFVCHGLCVNVCEFVFPFVSFVWIRSCFVFVDFTERDCCFFCISCLIIILLFLSISVLNFFLRSHLLVVVASNAFSL